MRDEDVRIWHYAVWMTGPYMEPACTRERTDQLSVPQGITIVRGDVNCMFCLRAMGDTETEDGDWASFKEWLNRIRMRHWKEQSESNSEAAPTQGG